MEPFLVLAALATLAPLAAVEQAVTDDGDDEGRIVGGVDVDIRSVPYQVAVEWNGGGQYCGGSIIDTRWILSAAHCFVPPSGSPSVWDKVIRVGSSLRNQGGQLYRVARIFFWEHFTARRFVRDVALLKLRTPIVLNPAAGVDRISLVEPSEQLQPGTNVIITGWGYEHYGDRVPPTSLQMVRTYVLHPRLCTHSYRFDNIKFTETMFCTMTNGRGSCNGDSGGPVVSEDQKLVGVVSWGARCGDGSFPSVSADISHPVVYNYIRQTMRDNS